MIGAVARVVSSAVGKAASVAPASAETLGGISRVTEKAVAPVVEKAVFKPSPQLLEFTNTAEKLGTTKGSKAGLEHLARGVGTKETPKEETDEEEKPADTRQRFDNRPSNLVDNLIPHDTPGQPSNGTHLISDTFEKLPEAVGESEKNTPRENP